MYMAQGHAQFPRKMCSFRRLILLNHDHIRHITNEVFDIRGANGLARANRMKAGLTWSLSWTG